MRTVRSFAERRLTVACLPLVLGLAWPALAQRGAIRGKIVDPDGAPLAGVSVSIVLLDGGGRPIDIETNENGEFTRAGLRSQDYRVSLELEGYEPLQAMVSVSSGGQAFINETLHPLPEGVLSPAQAVLADAHLEAAQGAFEAGDFQTAVTEFEGFLELMPSSAPAYFNLAAAHERLEDYPAAIAAYEKAYELGPEMAEGILAVADLHGRMEDWDAALAAFDRVLDLVEASAVNLFNYAVYASNAERPDLAEEFYEKATVADPEFATAFYQLGLAKARKEDREAAIAAFERFLELDPDGALAASALEVLDALRQPG